jgi:hypothetical protein
VGLNKSGLWTIPRAPPGQHLAVGQLAASPLISTPLPPSLPLRVSSFHVPYLLLPAFTPHFWILVDQSLTSNLDLPHDTSSLHPSSLLLLHTPCCTQDLLIYSSHFVFLSLAPLIVVGANGVVFFYKVVLNQVFALLLFDASCCFNTIVVFLRFLEVVVLW